MAAGRCDFLRIGDYCRGRDRGVNLGQIRSGNGFNGRSIKGDGNRRGGLFGRTEEGETGVVLNEIRSDVAVAYGVGVGNCCASTVENGERLSRGKKRKLFPILRDGEDEFYSQSPSADTGVSHGSVESSLAEIRYNLSPAELDPIKDDGCGKGYSISRSRWASVDDSLVDMHLAGDEMSGRPVMARHSDFLSSECGEFLKEGSVGSKARSSGSDEGSCLSGPSHGDECSEYELDNTESMEIGEGFDDGSGVDQMGYSSCDDVQGVQDSTVSMHGKVNMLQSCRSVFEYEKLNKINEGAYGVVYRSRDKKTGEIMALKKVKMGREAEREGFPLTALREINILLSFDHPSVVGVKEVVADEGDGIFMVMEYMEHDLKGIVEKLKQPFRTSEVKCLMKQLLEGVKYLHENWVIHRDLKTSNVLLNNRGELKICDFGLSRQYGSPLRPYTSLVVTLWYRAPEVLLGKNQYSAAIDMWSVGCIMAELLTKKVLFQGDTEIDQLGKIFRILGSPNEAVWPGFSELPGSRANFVKKPYSSLRKIFPVASFTGSPVLSDSGFDLLSKLLTFDPDKRITAEDALNHNWFREVPLPKPKDFMPTFPLQHC